jgi:hypothetical protein
MGGGGLRVDRVDDDDEVHAEYRWANVDNND